MESLGFSWEQVSNILRAGLVDPQSIIHEVEKSVGKVRVQYSHSAWYPMFTYTHPLQIVLQDIRSSWFNPPRRRRYLMKSLMDYLILINLLQQLTRQTPFEVRIHQRPTVGQVIECSSLRIPNTKRSQLRSRTCCCSDSCRQPWISFSRVSSRICMPMMNVRLRIGKSSKSLRCI